MNTNAHLISQYLCCKYGLGLGLCYLMPLLTIFQLYRESVLLVEEIGVPGENHRHVTSH